MSLPEPLSKSLKWDHCVTPSKEGPWFELSSRTRSCAHEPHTVTTRDTRHPIFHNGVDQLSLIHPGSPKTM
ncbi:hypothetical protein N657DRAFT_646935 [Parathielavia appendiculata]|uniref:Uncharacterized protein n=1 Tax=Parathielavia appendiculata TaxID=2587402 RepID=A0AAN6TX32_9PEZI|nr:hypothetical protein N657DRAFT_646935 [Parathielavia appendiculata]